MTYLRLDEAQIIQTLTRLRDRVRERFPGSGLSKVSEELLQLARDAAQTVDYLQRPNWFIRVSVGVGIVIMAAGLVIALSKLHVPRGIAGVSDLVQGLEAGINDLVFLGIAVFFLLTLETRAKRRKALLALHQLRSVVHIIDMHQLTKDPERLMSPQPDTVSSPERTMTAPELGRYLDYCSELLSLTSKISVLFIQQFNDPVVLGAVNEIETLSTGLSGKVWQKITLLERATARERVEPTLTLRDVPDV